MLVKVAVAIARHPAEYQYDLSAYYYGPLVWKQGGNPYERGSLRVLAHSVVQWFVYPPITIPLFRPLGFLSYSAAYYTWLVAKLVALVGLLAWWRRRFVGERNFLLFLVLCVFGLGSGLIRDLNAGNISIFEQLVLWVGIAALLDGKPLVFGLLVAVVGQIKLLPLGLLVLLAVPGRQWKALAISAGTALLLLGLNFVLYPAFTRIFFQAAAGIDQRGENNPASLAAVRDLVELVPGVTAATTHADEIVFVAFVGVLAAVTLWAVFGRPGSERRSNDRLAVGIVCFAFALAAPRFKLYSYPLLLVPAWTLLSGTRNRTLFWAGIAALAVSTNYLTDLLPSAGGYWPLVTAFTLWVLCVRELRSAPVGSPASAGAMAHCGTAGANS